ncbi:hypothetical protein ACH79_43325 [Bradyrhizobium sp. CCBAU 051011]|uniref:hypothetical protein n=1 Tax=Bradyrhizobium sp. CCBAU 051011 TaxID=858422 RepID=UPI00137407B3|nr:hypothetical protein [Bradyrhizobium sp. CCBAU 051011]QHO78408.1 hypothetical protein ACH79_43325 [Bradyrhizobium sp. CCBAU 051011]
MASIFAWDVMRKCLLALLALTLGAEAFAQDHGRIKRPPPSPAEAERIASEMAMNDTLLQKGDIVVTDRGFFLFRGLASDGVTNEFARVPDPALQARQPGNLTAKYRSDSRRQN